MNRLLHGLERWLVAGLVACGLTTSLGCPGQTVKTCEELGNCEPEGDAPLLYVSPAFGVGFDCTAIGCNQLREVTVENRGGGVLTLMGADLTMGSSADFSVLPSERLPVDLPPGFGTSVIVTYRPLDAQKDYGMLRLSTMSVPHSDQDSEVEIELKVRQSGDPVLGLYREDAEGALVDLAAEDHTISFGFVPGGTSGVRQLVIRNDAEGTAILELFALAPGPDFDSGFVLPTLSAADMLINPGADVTLPIELAPGIAPADARLYDSTIVIRSSDPIYPEKVVRLFGTAIDVPIVDVTPGSIDMGTTRYLTPQTAQIVLRNSGGVDLVVTPLLINGGEYGFSLSSDGAQLPPIGPFEQATLDVNLDASVGGPVDGYVRLNTNDPLRPRIFVSLVGFVNAPLVRVQPAPIVFGDLILTWSESAPVEVSNIGHGPLEISDIRLEIGTSTQFALLGRPDFPVTLLPDDPPIELGVDFNAYLLGAAQGQLVVESDSIDYARTEVAINGRGISCQEGCVIPHAEPDCYGGQCGIGDCDPRYHDADGDEKNGCECLEENPEVGAFCSSADEVGTINDTSRTRTGNLHGGSDIDMYWFYAQDHSNWCWLWDPDGYIKVEFTSAPADLEFCVSYVDHQSQGDGCGMGSEQCGLRTWTFSNTSCGGDDDRDITVRVRARPGTNPGCAAYTIRFKSTL